MRLLHTSDWHLGRTLHRTDLHEAQAAFLDDLVATAGRERVDAVLVAGDVFDRAVPSVDAVRLYDEALLRLRDTGARVVLISGNHDSAVRLGVHGELLDRAGVHVRTQVGALARPVLLGDDHGEVAVYGLPYLEPEAVRSSLPADPGGSGEPALGHVGVLGRAMACVRADLATRPGSRSVVLAHAWVMGAEATDSERDITVGGTSRVPTTLFDGIDYTALGHLHGAQVLGEGLRYSGSPLAYSFSEARHTKGSWLVELEAGGVTRVDRVAAPVPRRLSALRGALAALLTDPALAGQEQDWLSVALTDAVRPEEAMTRLRSRFPHVLVLEWAPEGVATDDRGYGARIARRDDLEVAQEFVRHVRAGGAAGAPDAPEQALLGEAFEAGRLARASL